MKKIFILVAVLFSGVFFISCASTDVYENQDTFLFQDDVLITSETTSFKNGKLKEESKEIVSKTKSEDDGNMLLQKKCEKVTVNSEFNSEFFAYSVFGKPFLIAGCSAWEMLKCCGFAFINFAGGYSTIKYGNFLWKMPDVKASKAKYETTKEANRIKIYPEYHKPFTNNKITVSKMTYEASTLTVKEDEMQVTSKENYEYDNTLSVEQSIETDKAATAGVVGIIGTVITVPVSVVTWIAGAAYGIYDILYND